MSPHCGEVGTLNNKIFFIVLFNAIFFMILFIQNTKDQAKEQRLFLKCDARGEKVKPFVIVYNIDLKSKS